MKQLSWLIFGLVLLLSQCNTIVAAARSRGIHEGKACRPIGVGTLPAKKTCRKNLFCNGNTRRCARLGSLGAPCKKASTDCTLVTDAVCYRQQCYGNTARPKLAPCNVDSHCATGYCGVAGRCALQHLEGGICRRPQQCISGACDAVAAKCVVSQAISATTTAATTTMTVSTTKKSTVTPTLSSSTSSSSSSSSSSAASSTPASVAAQAAYASATPVSNSQAYSSSSSSSSSANRRMLVQRSGQVSKTGDVTIVDPDTANAAIRFVADSATPAALKQVPDTPLTGTPVTLRFHYAVTALQANSGQCSLIAFINDQQLTPSLPITADAQTGIAAFPYSNTAPVTTYAVTVVCDSTSAGTTLQLDTLTASVDPPTCDTSTTNCGFEASFGTSSPSDWIGVASGQSTGAITSSIDDVRTGLSAYQCVVAVEGDRCGLQRSVPASSLTPGTTYTLTFWSKSRPQISAPPTIRIGKSSVTYFNGASGIVTTSVAGDNNGFRQYTATFTLPNDSDQTDLKVQISTTATGTYDYDDFALIPAGTPSLNGGLPTGQCSGLDNCGFEGTGGLTVIDANGNTDTRAMCAVTTQDTFVRSGQQAQLCTITAPSDQSFIYLQGGGEHAYAVGSSYVWTFWVKLSGGATASSLTCNVWANNGDGALAYKGACPFTTATPVNGFRQVAVPFTAASAQMGVMIAMSDVGQYAFDDVSMLDGAIPTITYDATLPPLASGTSKAAFVQTCIGGFTNCDFETGYANGYALQFGPSSSCVVTSERLKVHAGTHALQCDSTADANVALQIAPKATAAGVIGGEQYTFSVWAKSAAATSGLGDGNAIYAVLDNVATPPLPMRAVASVVTDANGFVKYTATFTASANTDQPSIAVKLTTPGVYYLDSFALVHGIPLPSDGDCTGMPNCSFEEGSSTNSSIGQQVFAVPHFLGSGEAPFQPTTNANYVRSGLQAMLAVPIHQGDIGFLESNTSASGTASVVGAPYVWTFWAKISGAHINCVVWAKAGTGAVAYNGACPMTTAASVNGFRQIAIPFTASDVHMDVMIKITADWSSQVAVAVDDMSILAGQFTIDYDLTAGSALTVGSASTTLPQSPSCSGFHNCGFETGFENGLTWSFFFSSSGPSRNLYPCVATSNPAYVYQGTWALRCSGSIRGYDFSFVPQATLGILQPYVPYVFSFWVKAGPTSQYVPEMFVDIAGLRIRDQSSFAIYDSDHADEGMQTVTSGSDSTNGFAQLAVTISVGEETMLQEIVVNTASNVAAPPFMIFDNFDLSPKLPAFPEQWNGCNQANCGFENQDSLQLYAPLLTSSCSIISDDDRSLPNDSNGNHAAQCIISAGPNSAASFFVQRFSDDNTYGIGDDHTYTIGQPVILSFWVRTDSASTVVAKALTCIVWSNNGDGAVSYKGTCPVTAATPVNGFVQVAVQFTAATTDLGFMILINDGYPDTYLFDGLELISGFTFYNSIAYDSTANQGVTATENSAYSFSQVCEGGVINCGFETGYANGYTLLQVGPSSSCAVTHDASNVYEGKYALQCDSTADANVALQITPSIISAGLQAGTQYVFSFWAKSAASSSLGGISVAFDGEAAVSMQPGVSANGFTKYTAAYTPSSNEDLPSIVVTLSTPDVYYLDSFAISPPPLLPQQWNGCSQDNCGFENANSLQHYELEAGNDFGQSSCSVVSDASLSLPNDAGIHAAQCSLSADPNAFAFVQRLYDGLTYNVGQTYVLTFWVRTGSASTVIVDALTCIVWSSQQGGSNDVSYKGTCPITTAAPANGFVQVAVQFVATTADLAIFIAVNAGNPDTYLFDGIEITPGPYQITYDSTANHGVTASVNSAYPFQDGCFANFNNCNFETGYNSDWQLLQSPNAACGVYTRTPGVSEGSGVYALKCILNDDGSGNTDFNDVVRHTFASLGGGAASGQTFRLSIYLSASNRDMLFSCRLTTDQTTYDIGTLNWGQMYAQYHDDAVYQGENTQVNYNLLLTIDSSDPADNAFLSCSVSGAGTCSFDDFSLIQQ